MRVTNEMYPRGSVITAQFDIGFSIVSQWPTDDHNVCLGSIQLGECDLLHNERQTWN